MRKSLKIVIDNTDKAHADFIMAYYFTSIMYSVSSRICESLGLHVNSVLYVISSCALLWFAKSSILNLLRKKFVSYLFVAIPFVLLFLFSFLRGTSLARVNSYVILPLLIYIPMLIASFSVEDFQLFYDEIKKWSLAITVAGCLILLVQRTDGFYSMNYSYVLLFATLIHVNEAMKGTKKFCLLSVVEIALNLTYGSRGAILCLIAFVALQLLMNKSWLAVKIPIISFAFIAYLYSGRISETILAFMSSHNIHSRTLTLLLTRIEYVSGRDVLAANAQTMISRKPIVGWGVGAEVQVIGNYPHNIILELMIDYGQILGAFVFGVIVILLLKSILSTSGIKREILLVFISHGFVVLFVSASYLTWPGFYVLMGFVFNIMKSNRIRRIQSL